jgi:hypothetical protein
MTRDEWIADFSRRVGVNAPTPEEVEAILDLAAVAAHSSERTAAPVACWVGGRTGLSLEELQEAAQRVDSG